MNKTRLKKKHDRRCAWGFHIWKNKRCANCDITQQEYEAKAEQ